MNTATTLRENTMTTPTDGTPARRRRRAPINPQSERFETGFTPTDAARLLAACEAEGVKPAAYIRAAVLAALRKAERSGRG